MEDSIAVRGWWMLQTRELLESCLGQAELRSAAIGPQKFAIAPAIGKGSQLFRCFTMQEGIRPPALPSLGGMMEIQVVCIVFYKEFCM